MAQFLALFFPVFFFLPAFPAVAKFVFPARPISHDRHDARKRGFFRRADKEEGRNKYPTLASRRLASFSRFIFVIMNSLEKEAFLKLL